MTRKVSMTINNISSSSFKLPPTTSQWSLVGTTVFHKAIDLHILSQMWHFKLSSGGRRRLWTSSLPMCPFIFPVQLGRSLAYHYKIVIYNRGLVLVWTLLIEQTRPGETYLFALGTYPRFQFMAIKRQLLNPLSSFLHMFMILYGKHWHRQQYQLTEKPGFQQDSPSYLNQYWLFNWILIMNIGLLPKSCFYFQFEIHYFFWNTVIIHTDKMVRLSYIYFYIMSVSI